MIRLQDTKSVIYKMLVPLLIYIIILSTLWGIFSLSLKLPKRYSSPPTECDIDYWYSVMDEIKNASTLNVTKNESKIIHHDNVPINVTHYYIHSEYYGGRDIKIHVVVMYNGDVAPKPAVLFIHGYGEEWTMFKDYMKDLAKNGYVAVAIDAPGASGNSTPYPNDDPINIVNTTDGPEYSYFYHVAYGVMRTITFMTTLDFIESKRIIVSGISMGGLMTIITGAIDDRVWAIIPIVGAGNYLDSIESGSFANGLVPEEVSLESEKAMNTMKYFDLYAYAQRINKPVLYYVVTNDEYFNLIAFNDTYNAFNTTDKTLIIWPNSNHYGDPYWRDVLLEPMIPWIESKLNNTIYYSVVSTNSTKKNYIVSESISVSTGAIPKGKNIYLVYRDSKAVSSWKIKEMHIREGKYEASIVESDSPQITYYIVIGEYKDGRLIVYASTPIYMVKVRPMLIPLIIVIASIACLLIAIRTYGMSIHQIISEVQKISKEKCIPLVVWLMATSSIYLPSINMAGRKHITIWEILERVKILLRFEAGLITVPPADILAISAIFLIFILYSIRTKKMHLIYAIIILILPHMYTILYVLLAKERLGAGFSIGFYMAISALILAMIHILYPKISKIRKK